MSDTHSLGRLFVTGQDLDPDSPRFSKATVYEIEHPFRLSHALVVRVLGHRGFSLGWWIRAIDPEDGDAVQRHLLASLKSAEGTESFQAESKENYTVQQSRAALGEIDRHDVPAEDYIQ